MRIFLFFVAVFTPLLGETAPRTFSEFVGNIVSILNAAIGTMVVLALVIYFAGAVKQLNDVQHGEAGGMSKFLITGLGILFVMVSVWGILYMLQSTFFPTGNEGGASGGLQLE